MAGGVPVQNFGAMRIVKRNPAKTLGDEPGYLVMDASDALEVHVMEMPNITVSVPPVTVGDVSVIQKTTPWVISGDVSVPPITIATVSVTGQVSVLNFPTKVSVTQDALDVWAVHGHVSATILTSPLDVQQVGGTPWLVSLAGPASVTGQVSILGPVSVTGQVSVLNFPTATSVTGQVSVVTTSLAPVFTIFANPQPISSVAGNVSVVGNVSAAIVGNVSVSPVAGQVFAVSFASTQQIDVTDRLARVLGAVASVAGNVSVVGNVSATVAGNVSAAVAGNVSVIQSTSPWVVGGNVSAAVAGNVSATVVGAVSVVGQVSIVGPVSVTGQVSIAGNASFQTARVNLTPASPGHISVGTVASVAVAANASRKGLILTNKNTAAVAGIPIYLAPASVAILGSGITLYPNGGTYVMDEWTFTTASFSAIASAAGIASLAIQEYS